MDKKNNQVTALLDKTSTKRILLIAFVIIVMAVAAVKLGKIMVVIQGIIDIVFPFIIGACIAFVFNVPMRQIETRIIKKNFKGKRVVAYLLTLLLILGIIAGALGIVIPQLSESIATLAKELKVVFTEENLENSKQLIMEKIPFTQRYLKDITLDFSLLTSKLSEIVSKGSQLLGGSSSDVLSSVTGVVGNVASGVLSFLIGFAFSIYVLFNKEKLARQMRQILYAIFSEKVADKILEVGNLTQVTFSNFIRGQCLEAFILGCMFLITMSIVQLPYAFLCSVLIGLTALIPIFGAFVGCAISILLIATVSLKKAIIFVIVFIILQQLEGKLIYPHVVGSSVGLPGIWVLFAITVGGDLMGVAGMLIGVPTASVLYALFREFIVNRLKQKKVNKKLYDVPYEVRYADTIYRRDHNGLSQEEKLLEDQKKAEENEAKKAAIKEKVEELTNKKK